MKASTILLLAPLFCATHAFAQIIRAKPLSEKTAVPVAGAQNLRVVEEQKKPAPPPPPPTNIQSVLLDIQNGDDGKEGQTFVTFEIEDNNKRSAALYSDGPPHIARPQGGIQAVLGGSPPSDEYMPGTSISVPVPTQTSIPTGQTTKVGYLTLPVLRWATVADFSNGGELKITLDPTQNGHNDIWKIQSITARVSFENDPHSPHIIRWTNIVLASAQSPVRELFFDSNYKPI
jgi:hypothetical protein